MATPLVSVITPAYQSEKTIAALVAALDRQNYPKDKFEFILVDDGSSDSTYETARAALARTRIDAHLLHHVRARRYGPAPARNAALAVARGRLIAFTDADCIPDRDWLEQIERSLVVDGHAVIGGDIRCEDALIFPWRVSPAGHDAANANMAIDLAKTGPFRYSEDFWGAGCEDLDLIFRLQHQGHAMHSDRMVRIEHPPNVLGIKRVCQRAYNRTNEIIFFKKHGRAALSAMGNFFRPRFFGRISIAAVVAAVEIGALAILIFGSQAARRNILIIAGVAMAAFISGGYRATVTYNPAGRPVHMNLGARLWTMVTVAVYLPVFLVGRLVGSWRYRIFVL
jgi:glycosyltransferase involved in cell wall biosynthesis